MRRWIGPGCVLGIAIAGLPGCVAGSCPQGSALLAGECVPIACPEGEDRSAGDCSPRTTMREPAIGAGGARSADAGGMLPRADAGAYPDASAQADASSDAAGSDAGDPGADVDSRGACAGLECGVHGRCAIIAGEPSCVCEPGYLGARCGACEAGLGHAGDDCVSLCDSDDAPECGLHGSCASDGSALRCECERGFAGESCDACAEGFSFAGARCVADCGPCGAHEFCDGELRTPQCACVAGYAHDAAGDCLWVGDGATGGIENGAFEDDRGWSGRGVEFTSGAARFVTRGVGTACELGLLSQTLTMPARQDAEPLVLEMRARTNCTSTNPEDCPPLLVEFGSSVTRVRVPGAATASEQTLALCLGEAGYGGSVPLAIRPGLARESASFAFPCDATAWPALTELRIRSAQPDECPPEGGLWSDASGPTSAWTLAGATLTEGELAFGTTAGMATTRAEFPLPSTLPHPALAFTKSSGFVAIRLDGLQWTTLPTGSTGAQALCVPDFAQGAVHELTFVSSATTLGDLHFVSDDRCGDGGFDFGFERGLGTGSWYAQSAVDLVNAAATAHAGMAALHTRVGVAGNLRGIARIAEPIGEDAGHAAFSVWHRLDTAGTAGVIAVLGSGQAWTKEFRDTGWGFDLYCPGRAWDGQVMSFGMLFSARHGGSVPSATDASGWLDDSGPQLDPLCQ